MYIYICILYIYIYLNRLFVEPTICDLQNKTILGGQWTFPWTGSRPLTVKKHFEAFKFWVYQVYHRCFWSPKKLTDSSWGTSFRPVYDQLSGLEMATHWAHLGRWETCRERAWILEETIPKMRGKVGGKTMENHRKKHRKMMIFHMMQWIGFPGRIWTPETQPVLFTMKLMGGSGVNFPINQVYEILVMGQVTYQITICWEI